MWRQKSFVEYAKILTCCDDFDTEDVELDDEFSRFCRDASPFVVSGLGVVTVVGGLSGFFLLKFSNIEAISGDMFWGVLLTIIVSGSSDIWKSWKEKNFWVKYWNVLSRGCMPMTSLRFCYLVMREQKKTVIVTEAVIRASQTFTPQNMTSFVNNPQVALNDDEIVLNEVLMIIVNGVSFCVGVP